MVFVLSSCNQGAKGEYRMLKKGPDLDKPIDVTDNLSSARFSWNALANPGLSLRGTCLNQKCQKTNRSGGCFYIKKGLKGSRGELKTNRYAGWSLGDEIEEATCPCCGEEVGENIDAVYFYNCHYEVTGRYYVNKANNTKCKVRF